MSAHPASLWSVLPLLHQGFELRDAPFLSRRPPREEPFRFSGGVNLSAQERNAKRLNEALVVYGFSAQPGVLFCAPWVAEILRAALRGEIPGISVPRRNPPNVTMEQGWPV